MTKSLFESLEGELPLQAQRSEAPPAADPWFCSYTAEECFAIADTPKAVLVRGLDVPEGKAWVPRRCINPRSEIKNKGDRGSLMISHAFAGNNGWLDFLLEDD